MPNLRSRVFHGFAVLLGVSFLSFALFAFAPGNFFDELKLNPKISPDTVSSLEAKYGLDKPIAVRYAHWISSVAHGDFGYSLSYNCPVNNLLWVRARNTLVLTILATLLAWAVALPWGIGEALNKGGWFDQASGGITAFLLAVPEMLLALALLLFAAKSGLFPTGGMQSTSAAGASLAHRTSDLVLHMVLPVFALVLGSLPILVRHIRAAMVQVLESPYIEAARAHGISRPRIVLRHALPVAANSLISLFGFSIGALLSMSLLTEVIMSWPGLGPLLLEAVLARDIFVVVDTVLLAAIFLVAGNLIADILLYAVDPRIRAV